MKKTCNRVLCLLLCVCMVLSLGILVSAEGTDAAAFADQWVYDAEGDYWALDVVYCDNPTLVGGQPVQHLAIYAPGPYLQKNDDGSVTLNPDGKVASSNGVVYTAENAPMIYGNTSGGYSSSSIKPADAGYLNEGYIHVSINTRGKETQDDDGKYIGQFPVLIVDLKAGIRFLKANDDVLPGNSDRIISVGGSSGGAVSAMLGTSGNSPVFDSYLKEIGAADATDDIFMAVAWCPITNLNTNDAAYEWFMAAAGEYFLFNAMAVDREGNNISNVFPVGPTNYYPLGSNMLGGNHEDELSEWLYNWYVKYVQSFGLDLGDDGRSGAYYTDLSQAYADSLAEYIARYDEFGAGSVEDYIASISGIAELDEKGNVIYVDDDGVKVYQMLEAVAGGRPGQSKAYYVYHDADGNVVTDEDGNVKRLDSANAALTGENWFTYDPETGKVEMTLDDFIQGYIKKNQSALGNNTAISRNKMAPSLDSYNYRSNEGDAFVNAEGERQHFSKVVRDGLKYLLDNAQTYGWTEEELAYIQVLYEDYAGDITEESDALLEIMSPINYVVGTYESNIAPYFRWKIGSADGDQGAPAGWLTHQALLKYHPEIVSNYGISWGVGHGNSELTMKDLYAYIDEVMVDEDDPEVMPYTDVPANAWYVDDLSANKALGIVDGYEDGTFAPESSMTVAEAVKTAAVIHQLDADGAVTLTAGDDVWYSTYMAYAVENGIIDADLSDRADELITRAEFVKIFYKALPTEKYAAINTVEDGAIPDVEDDEAVYAFYRAGIVIGYEDGSFLPETNIKRSEVTAISVRMLNEDARKAVTLEKKTDDGNSGGWGGNSGGNGGWGGSAPSVTAEQITEGFYVLNESRTRAFLAVGEDKALLIDAMYANDNVLDEVRKITDLPVEVIITHGHPDHIGGIDAFDACYIHEADAYFLAGKDITLNYVKDGDTLTVGGFTFEVIETPGHTKGSISLLERAHKLLITGDEVQAGPIMMFDEECDMAAYAASMQKLLAYKDDVETIYAGHNDPTGVEFIQYCYDDATAYLNGELTGTPVTSWDGATRVDYQGAHVTFRLAE